VIEMCRGRGQGYAGQGLGLADLVAALYFSELREGLDRLVLSTGHSAIVLFAALHEQGLYELDELRTYGMDGSRIEESPLEGTPGFEITGGSLGQGPSQAVGIALGERLRGSDARVYCILSDGELQERAGVGGDPVRGSPPPRQPRAARRQQPHAGGRRDR
jgi:transketolase